MSDVTLTFVTAAPVNLTNNTAAPVNLSLNCSDIQAWLNSRPSYANDEAAIAAGLTAGVSWYILNDQTDIGTPWTLRRVAP